MTYERRLLALSLGSEKLPHSLDIVKDEAIVNAPLVRICIAASIIRDLADVSHIHASRGHLPLLIPLYRAVVGLLERNEQVSDSRLSFFQDSHQEAVAQEDKT